MRQTRLRVVSGLATSASAPAPVDGYVRVSHLGGRGGEHFISPDLQEERIRAYARSRGLEIGVVYRELDRSGTDRERPLLLAALARVERRESGGIVVAKIDRFARSALDALTALQQIETAGGLFISVEDGFDSSTPFGRAMMTILLALAELELARVREVWDSAQANAVARGVHTSTQVPAGYRRTPSGRLLPDTAIAPLIAEAFRRRAYGATYQEIAERLSAETGRVGRGSFRRAGVAKMLKSRVYLGEASYGRYRNPAAHPPLVSARLWLAAQATAPNYFPHPAAETLLSGLIRCAGCSHLLSSSWTQRTAGGTKTRELASYRCRRRKTEVCTRPVRVRATEIEPIVVEQFFALLRARRRRPGTELEQLEHELRGAELSLAQTLNGQRTSDGAPERQVAITTLSEAERMASRRLRTALRRAAFDQLPSIRRLERLWPQMTTADRRKALGTAFDAIVVEDGGEDLARRVHFLRAGELLEDLPRQGRPGPTRAWSLACRA